MKTLPGTETKIHIVYPHPEQQIFDDSTFLMGGIQQAPAGAKLFINKKRIPVSKHGFFAWKVPIHVGMNPVQVEVKLSESTPPIAQSLFALQGSQPLPVLPATPLKIHEKTLKPAQDVWVLGSDVLTVACSASVDAEISFSIPGWLKGQIPLHPLDSRETYLDTREVIFAQKHWTAQRTPVKGYYQAKVSVAELLEKALPAASYPENAAIVLHLKHGGQTLEKTLPGRLTVLRQPKPAVINHDRAVTRTMPPDGSRLTPQRNHTACQVDGLEQGWARVRLSRDEAFYIALPQLSLVPKVAELMALATIRTEPASPTDSLIRLAFHQQPQYACPVQIESVPNDGMNRLQIRLYGVCAQCDFIHYPPEDEVVRQIHWRQVAENVLELWIDLRRPLAGYDYFWQAGEWHFQVRTLPKQLSAIKILIDPGHGGTESGSTGLNGLPEKNLNLTVSRLLRDALLKEGFQVDLTRNGDETLSLQARGTQVETKQPHMVLSLHHNALPDGRDPLQAQGACTFYYQAFSKPLAEALLKGLTEPLAGTETIPNYGLFYDSLYMTRIHQALAVLIEVGFFTNPDEFERLIRPEFQQQVVRRLANALRQYCLDS